MCHRPGNAAPALVATYGTLNTIDTLRYVHKTHPLAHLSLLYHVPFHFTLPSLLVRMGEGVSSLHSPNLQPLFSHIPYLHSDLYQTATDLHRTTATSFQACKSRIACHHHHAEYGVNGEGHDGHFLCGYLDVCRCRWGLESSQSRWDRKETADLGVCALIIC